MRLDDSRFVKILNMTLSFSVVIKLDFSINRRRASRGHGDPQSHAHEEHNRRVDCCFCIEHGDLTSSAESSASTCRNYRELYAVGSRTSDASSGFRAVAIRYAIINAYPWSKQGGR